ncbi:MAG TPA: hypothetical protein DCG32_01950 [Sphaerochaeta sp.]|nr:hypothetical protein [Sphaerochaeta sp.]
MDGNDEKQRIPKSPKGRRHTLVLFGIWLVFTATVLVIGLPIVLESVRQSGVLPLLNAATGTTSNQQQARIWFYSSDGSLREFRQEQVKQGGSAYHDTFESLLSGPNLQALKKGAISSIDPKTTLRGITLSNKVLYIDLSKQFLESRDVKKAYEQLRRTAKGFPQIKDIVLLIEGERATLPADL